jgi:hypothetical protein
MLSTAILWWNAHVLPLTPRWWDGFAFYPATGFMALSDHRLGESLLATPLQWLGCTPITAYNITLLATFPLCAMAAHWLGFVVTKRHDAAAICGVAYAFCPYRVAALWLSTSCRSWKTARERFSTLPSRGPLCS